MKRLIVIVLVGFLAWQGYARYDSTRASRTARQGIAASETQKAEVVPASQFKCDGRTRCSQMTSCAEATFFLKNCPGVKMDGNNDGVPCEQQWCK